MSNDPILYVAPQPPTVSGIADYAARFRLAFKEAGIEHRDISFDSNLPTRAEVRQIFRGVRQQAKEGELAELRLAHLEIALFSYREYFYAQALRRYTDLPIIFTLHEPAEIVLRPYRYLGMEDWPRPLRVGRKFLDDYLGTKQKYQLLGRASRVCVLGPKGAADMASWKVKGKVEIIPHVSYARQPRQRPNGPPRVVFGGFHGVNKGLETLLAAFQALQRSASAPKAKLVVTGATFSDTDTPVEMAIKKSGIPEEAIEMTGFLTETGLQELFAGAAVVVIPYLPASPAGSSAMLIRSLSAGAPTVVSDIPALVQDVTDGATALIFPAGDANALAERLERVLRDHSLAEQLGSNAAAKIARENAPKVVGEQIRVLYQKVSKEAA